MLKKVGGDCGRSRGGRGEGGVGKSTGGEEVRGRGCGWSYDVPLDPI